MLALFICVLTSLEFLVDIGRFPFRMTALLVRLDALRNRSLRVTRCSFQGVSCSKMCRKRRLHVVVRLLSQWAVFAYKESFGMGPCIVGLEKNAHVLAGAGAIGGLDQVMYQLLCRRKRHYRCFTKMRAWGVAKRILLVT
jgi:hypothetical protein